VDEGDNFWTGADGASAADDESYLFGDCGRHFELVVGLCGVGGNGILGIDGDWRDTLDWMCNNEKMVD
jgi:hypothetical protein